MVARNASCRLTYEQDRSPLTPQELLRIRDVITGYLVALCEEQKVGAHESGSN
jgi:hypothetical protein